MKRDELFDELPAARVIYRDDALIALDKPAGLSTASSDGADDLLKRVKRRLALERSCDARDVYVGLHESLERDTSGVVIFTLDKRANAGLARQLEQRTPRRTHHVLTHGDVVARAVEHTQLRAAELRRQLAQRGTPVLGDVTHSGDAAARLLCHATSIELRHPLTDGALQLSAPVPITLQPAHAHAQRLLVDPEHRRASWIDAALMRAPLREHAAFRWIHGASDRCAGLAVDVYDQWLVLHLYDEAWSEHRATLATELHALSRCAGVYVKRHPRQKNTLDAESIAALAHDRPQIGEPAPDPLAIDEHGAPLFVRLGDGLRTGLFLDQRDNRARVQALAREQRVLNLFAYTCGFSVAALVGGAREVVSVDASAQVMARVEPSLAALAAHDRHRTIVGDCFATLERLREAGERFDLVVVDPPSYATSSAGRFRIRHDYPQLAAAVAAIAGSGARILYCANHHALDERDLQRMIGVGLERAGRHATEIKRVPPPSDFSPAPGEVAELKSVWVTLDEAASIRKR